MTTVNGKDVEATIDAFKWPVVGDANRRAQAKAFLDFLDKLESPLSSRYLDGAQATEPIRVRAFSPGASRQTIGFIRHQLNVVSLSVLQNIAEQDRTGRVTPEAISGAQRHSVDKLLTALRLEVRSFDAYLINQKKAGEPVPDYWKPL